MNRGKKIIIVILIIFGLGIIYYVLNHPQNNCRENDEECFKRIVSKCLVSAEYSQDYNDGNIKMKREFKVMGIENNLCKVLVSGKVHVEIEDKTTEDNTKYYHYYELGNPTNLVERKMIKN